MPHKVKDSKHIVIDEDGNKTVVEEEDGNK